MNQEELNQKTIELLQEKLKQGRKSLLVAIMLDLDTQQYSQLVGYGVSLPLVKDAFDVSYKMLEEEVRKKKQS